MLEIGDIVYHINSKDPNPVGTIIGIRETRWSDKGVDFIYTIETPAGRVRNVYDDSLTNEKPTPGS